MLKFTDGTLPEPNTVVCTNYTWDAGIEDFKCMIRGADVDDVWEIVKQYTRCSRMPTPHISTDEPSSPYSCDIIIVEDDPLGREMVIEFKRFNWETWDDEDGTIKLTGRYRG